MRYCVLYPETKNVHLIKDVGMIAYKMNKLFGWESFVATYNNDDYNYLNKEVKGLKMDFINKKHNAVVDGITYLNKFSNKIDVLQIFHVTLRSVLYAYVYKSKNSGGKIFLKLDCTEQLLEKIKGLTGIKKMIFMSYFNKVDVIGVEQKELYSQLIEILPKFKNKIINITNGIDYSSTDLYNDIQYSSKENNIITVGRIGSIEKCSDKIMEAFSMLDEEILNQWKLIFIGPIEDGFKQYINSFFIKNPNLKDKIIFTGGIEDRHRLNKYYLKSKIFCLSSQYESFAIALLEAASFGNVIVSTNVGIAPELVQGDQGRIVRENKAESLKDALKEIILDDNKEKYSNYMVQLCKSEYNWDIIVDKLKEKLTAI
ncbi:MAG: glycosyltransferase [Clostridiaceae bacterium]|jgi:glycosyltransferase involved in cell wall biosynthesis|nr:glycosyltransferase [Clostridiaceae bacterium]